MVRTHAKPAFDIAVIGAGVVGCAMARRFALAGAAVAVFEKAADILDGASKANSAILHTGFDAPTGSLEQKLVRRGYREYEKLHASFRLPLKRPGALVVAWTHEQEDKLERVVDQAHENGVDDVRLVSRAALLKREPNLSSRARAAALVPGEALIDPWSAPYSYLAQAIEQGARLFRQTPVTGGAFDGRVWNLKTPQGLFRTRVVINCAGLYGDLLEQGLLGQCHFTIKPRKGQFVVFDKAAHELIESIILPVPTERSKGVLICRTVFGNLLVGPTAEDQNSRSDTGVSRRQLEKLIEFSRARIPKLADMPVTATYAGIRPASERKDYRLQFYREHNWIVVGGIRSTGLTAALGIADYVYDQFEAAFSADRDWQPRDAPPPRQVPRLDQADERDWMLPDNGGIVCHCEQVTRREVDRALQGPLAAQSLAGLKRCTRVAMGRCQGFYCVARLAELTEGKLTEPFVESLPGQPAE